jgi:hypothetical protein
MTVAEQVSSFVNNKVYINYKLILLRSAVLVLDGLSIHYVYIGQTGKRIDYQTSKGHYRLYHSNGDSGVMLYVKATARSTGV